MGKKERACSKTKKNVASVMVPDCVVLARPLTTDRREFEINYLLLFEKLGYALAYGKGFKTLSVTEGVSSQ